MLKLAIGFALVVMAGLAVVAVYVSRSTVGEFSTFMVVHDSEALVARWADYYDEHGSWEGVEFLLAPAPNNGGEPRPPVPQSWLARGRSAVVDVDGRVVLAGQGYEVGQIVPREVVRKGMPIEVDGVEVGRLLLGYPPEGPAASQRFLQRFNQALLVGGSSALVLAVTLGIVLSGSLTKPLRELRSAAEALTRGEQVEPIVVRSRDEIGQLAESFNLMTSELSRSQRLRRQMTADIAHELRTPLTIILGNAEAMADGVLPANQETLGIIYDEASRLSRLVDDLRTLSLSDAGELSLVVEAVAPEALVQSAANAHRVAAQEAKVELAVEVEPNLPDVHVDSGRILQVIHNLLSNALRYSSPGGRVVLSARRSDGEVVFSVSDNGAGISPEDLPNVFERLYRGDRARQRAEGGTGLGLTIARSLVERHGGRIWATSELGKGATFCFALPVKPSAEVWGTAPLG